MSNGNSNILSLEGVDPEFDHRFVRRWCKEPIGQAETVVLCIHGIESHSGWFEQFASFTTVLGVDCFSYDRIGHGHSRTLQLNQAENIDEMSADLASLFTQLQSVYARVVVLAMSWGGLLTAYALSEKLIDPAATILLVPGIYPIKSISFIDTLKVALGVLSGRSTSIYSPLAPEDFSDDKAVVNQIRKDALRRIQVSAPLLYATRKLQEKVRKGDYFRRDVEIWLAESDRIIDNEASVVFAKMHGISVRKFSGHGHCLIFECPEKIADAVLKKIGVTDRL